MHIGIDIDEVLCETIDYVLDFQGYTIAGRSIQRSDFTDYYIKNLPGFEGIDLETTVQFFTTALSNHRVLTELNPVHGAFEALQKGKNAGHKFYAITARGSVVKEKTLERINHYFPSIFEEVIFCHYHEADKKISKEEVCRRYDIRLFVEDNLSYAQALASQGIKSFLLAKKRNTKHDPIQDSLISRIPAWDMVDFDHREKKKYYITTAIPYMNGAPHAGHALEIIQTDALARMRRFLGYDVVFQTGSDDHGIKNRNTAQAHGIEVRDFVNQNAQSFFSLYESLDSSYTDFVHTSDEKKHYPGAQLMREKLNASGDIYKKSYQGLYCEGCEAMKLEKDLVNGCCPDHPGKSLQEIQEENYFFRLSKYKDQIKNLIFSDSYRIEPEVRKNEILAFLEKAEDVSFSRQKEKMPRGIPVPGDSEHVMYVWCDALTNYLTGQGFGRNDNRKEVWAADIHVVGKDILRFHAAFWPAMLLSANLPLPKTLLAHGHLTLNGEKMSKSTGNVIDPNEVIAVWGRDPFVFNLLYDVSLNADGDFSIARLESVYNSMLIGAWGNLVNRVTNLCKKYNITKAIAHKQYLDQRNQSNSDLNFETFLRTMKEKYLENFNLQSYLQDWYKLVQSANELITREEPWKKYKEEASKEEAVQVLQFLLYIIKNLTLLSSPILTQGFNKLKAILGTDLFADIDTAQTIEFWRIKEILDCKIFEVNLNPEILYQKIEKEGNG